MKRIAFYGGSFDPVHRGHIAVARALVEQFVLDQFVFIPAFHAPHKNFSRPTSAYDRYALLCLVTRADNSLLVSKVELEMPEKPYSVETLTFLNSRFPKDDIFFVMGADSWNDITTWREWETVLSISNHIVMTRPGSSIVIDHITEEIRERIVDLRGKDSDLPTVEGQKSIFFTDRVNIDVSATSIRRRIREQDRSWRIDVPPEVAIYIEKYQIYK